MAQDLQRVNRLSMRGFLKNPLTSGTILLKEDIGIWSSSSDIASSSDKDFSVGNGTHLAMTNIKRKLPDGSFSNASHQVRCKYCKRFKSKIEIWTCRNNGSGNIVLCHSEIKRNCFHLHLKGKHAVEIT